MRSQDFEDDGRRIADMSGIERTPLVIPRKKEADGSCGRNRTSEADAPAGSADGYRPPDILPEERRALIGGAVSAALLAGGIIAAAFAAVIYLILHMWS